MSTLVLAVVIAFIAGCLIGFALGMNHGANIVIERWRKALATESEKRLQ